MELCVVRLRIASVICVDTALARSRFGLLRRALSVYFVSTLCVCYAFIQSYNRVLKFIILSSLTIEKLVTPDVVQSIPENIL